MKNQIMNPKRMGVRCVVLSLSLLASTAATAHSQQRRGRVALAENQTRQLVIGDSVRVKLHRVPSRISSSTTRYTQPRIEGIVVRLTADTLWYRPQGVRVSAVAAALDDAEIERPTHRDHRVAGAVLGGVALGVVGAVLGYSAHEPKFSWGLGCVLFDGTNRCHGSQPQINSRREDTWLAATALGGVGAFAGYFLGKTLGRWETVEFDQITTRDGAVSVSLGIPR